MSSTRNVVRLNTGARSTPPEDAREAATSAEFTSERMLRPRKVPPPSGWRRLLFRASGGLVHVGPSAAEQRHQRLLEQTRIPVAGWRRIAVLSRKGGIGKTTTTLMLGHTFATHRGDRVVALDANPDAGSLAHRVARSTPASVTQLLSNADLIVNYSDVRAYTNHAPSRLEVVASDDDPSITEALGEDDYARVLRVLERHYNLLLIDTGTGILDSATQGILKEVDQIVLCAASGIDASRASSQTLDWLERNGYAGLARNAVVAMNQVRDVGRVDLDQMQKHFAQRCRAVVRVPWDPALEAGYETSLEDLLEPTRAAYLELAAAVASQFEPGAASEAVLPTPMGSSRS